VRSTGRDREVADHWFTITARSTTPTPHGEEEAQMVQDLFAVLQAVVTEAGLELVDVEMKSGVLQVTVDREGGVDLEALTDANRAVSTLLDEVDPIPGRYSLEVSSPGIERTLRTPAHFAKAVGSTVSIKTRPQVPGDRRLQGTLVASDEDGFVLAVEGSGEEPIRLAYGDIDRARTVFVWGGQKPSVSGRSGGQRPGQKTTQTQKRKQVPTT
jgi:ribosome maturation factor RimP